MKRLNRFLAFGVLINAVGVTYFLHKFQAPWQAYLSLAAVTFTAIYFFFMEQR